MCDITNNMNACIHNYSSHFTTMKYSTGSPHVHWALGIYTVYCTIIMYGHKSHNPMADTTCGHL